jgi:hypothetical protein
MPRKKSTPQADDTFVEGDDALEPFEQPVPVVKADADTPDGVVKVRVLAQGRRQSGDRSF